MGDMDWKIWGTKLLKGVGLTALTGAMFYAADYIGASTLPTEYMVYGGLAVTLLTQVANFIKHQYLVDA